ncbi:hypothetical protein A8135_06465 [Legionella jamestowniensis]|uniref:Uncharacterized protein n=1 Tax=Legionella jamestowniensis TaxID=455 RepID=A0ABX2XV35_9GAMM|nr:hypothetical protein [Legionella jamestowniensis]OCH96796.1 hypothetical protein A8135_06465 [Legionella jamestowniensis]
MRKLLLLITISLVVISHYGFSQHLRIGILDSFSYQKYVSVNYEKYYMDGFNLARVNAFKKGVEIEYKIFRYRYDGLSIVNAIKNCKSGSQMPLLALETLKVFLLWLDI